MAEEKKGYGKRPLWQWVVLYAIIAAVVYGLIYYFVFAKKSGFSYNTSTSNQPSAQSSSTPATSSSATTSNIYLVKTSPKGKYLTDFNGMTLYVFDKDTKGVTNCYNGCAVTWPPYSSGAMAQGQLPASITVVTRTDGSKQYAWNGMPLYYYASDTSAGQMNGDGVGGVWHLAKP